MIETGKRIEEIVAMLSVLKMEVKSTSALGWTNLNKHTENFIKRILNLIYDLDLINLNDTTITFPGLDLGDRYKEVAYQITATRTSTKIDETLATCLRHDLYKTFPFIKIFILTGKQSSYAIKTETEPHFHFSPKTDIVDVDDLYSVIQNLDPIAVKNLHHYIQTELPGVIDSLKGNEPARITFFLDTQKARKDSEMPFYCLFHTTIELVSEKKTVPFLLSELNSFVKMSDLRLRYFPVFFETSRRNISLDQLIYCQNLTNTNVANFFHGYAFVLEPSRITIEKADYANNEFLNNLDTELISLLIAILFFGKILTNNYTIKVNVHLESNHVVYLAGQQSKFISNLWTKYVLNSPYTFSVKLDNIFTSTLVDLWQEVLNGFPTTEYSQFNGGPFIGIDKEKATSHINNFKSMLGISY